MTSLSFIIHIKLVNDPTMSTIKLCDVTTCLGSFLGTNKHQNLQRSEAPSIHVLLSCTRSWDNIISRTKEGTKDEVKGHVWRLAALGKKGHAPVMGRSFIPLVQHTTPPQADTLVCHRSHTFSVIRRQCLYRPKMSSPWGTC